MVWSAFLWERAMEFESKWCRTDLWNRPCSCTQVGHLSNSNAIAKQQKPTHMISILAKLLLGAGIASCLAAYTKERKSEKIGVTFFQDLYKQGSSSSVDTKSLEAWVQASIKSPTPVSLELPADFFLDTCTCHRTIHLGHSPLSKNPRIATEVVRLIRIELCVSAMTLKSV